MLNKENPPHNIFRKVNFFTGVLLWWSYSANNEWETYICKAQIWRRTVPWLCETNCQIPWQNHSLKCDFLERHIGPLHIVNGSTWKERCIKSSGQLPLSRNKRMIPRKWWHFHAGWTSMTYCQSCEWIISTVTMKIVGMATKKPIYETN